MKSSAGKEEWNWELKSCHYRNKSVLVINETSQMFHSVDPLSAISQAASNANFEIRKYCCGPNINSWGE